jgi:hypothetical protein
MLPCNTDLIQTVKLADDSLPEPIELCIFCARIEQMPQPLPGDVLELRFVCVSCFGQWGAGGKGGGGAAVALTVSTCPPCALTHAHNMRCCRTAGPVLQRPPAAVC